MASDKHFAQKLKEAGTRLLSPPSSVDELLPILDEVEKILENVEQSPSETMQDALWPTRNALVLKDLLGHTDPDVNVSVATCISEITRITAPDAPYSDDEMKEIFQLIVSTFEKLHDVSSRSFSKRTAILDIVAKVRSCVVMLDLECDALILQMFQHFLKSVTDNHPEKVFSSMETIMTLVIEESEEISPELLSPILETLKKDNTSVDPTARRLGENVLNNCASKVKPYLVQAIKTLGVSLDDYSNAIATLCQEAGYGKFDDANTTSKDSANQVDFPNPSSGEVVKEGKGTLIDTAQDEVSPAPDKLESTMSNGNLPKVVEEAEGAEELLTEKKSDDDDHIENKATEKPKTMVKPKPKGKSHKKKGRKGNSSKSTSKPSAEATPALGNGAEEDTDLQENKSKDSGNLQCEDSPADNKSPSNSEKEADIQKALSKASENEALDDVPSPSPSGGLPERSHTKKADIEIKGTTSVPEVRSMKDPEVEASKSKVDKVAGQEETSSATCKEEISLRPVDESNDDKTADDLHKKTKKVSNKKIESGSDQKIDKKRKGQVKPGLTKEHVKPPPKKESKEPALTPTAKSTKKEPSSASSKRKRSTGKEKASEVPKFGEDLIGSKIRVWWPKDKQFYKGIVESFIPATKKHKVLYSDGDVEVLNLAKENWHQINIDDNSDKGDVSDGETPAASEMRTKKKTKTIPETSNKSGNTQSAKKKVGGTSSSRSKVAVSKPGSKQSNEEVTVEKTSNDEDPKHEKGENSSEADDSGDESMDETPKAGGKSKEDDVEIPKPSTKGKQQTAKGNAKSKGKTGKDSGSKSAANKTGKVKAGSSVASKEKESEKTKKSLNESAKSSQGGNKKALSSTPMKSLKSETNSAKKRKRGSSKK